MPSIYPEEVLTSRGWGQGAEQWYQDTHSVNQQTGAISGPVGPIPAGIGLPYQDAHQQGVWRHQQSLLAQSSAYGSQASQWGQGALGLLQSFRPGGGSDRAMGAYQNLANIDLQRAQLEQNRAAMTQPMDLLADYRRDAAWRSQRDAKKGAIFGAIANTVAAGASLIPGVGPALAMGIQGGSNIYGATQGGQTQPLGLGGQPQQGGQQGPQQMQVGAPLEFGGGANMLGGAPTDTPSGGGEDVPGPAGQPAGGGPSEGNMQLQQMLLSMLMADQADDPSWEFNNAAVSRQSLMRMPGGLG